MTSELNHLIDQLVAELTPIAGVAGIVLGGSHARGRARADSDVDLGLIYSDAQPIDIDAIRSLAQRISDRPDPIVSGSTNGDAGSTAAPG